jgi:RecA/RadA recombinase
VPAGVGKAAAARDKALAAMTGTLKGGAVQAIKLKIVRVPLGISWIDRLIPGLPEANWVFTIFGEDGSGKTSTAYQIAAPYTQSGHVVLLVSTEEPDGWHAEACGVDTNNLIVIKRPAVEDAFDIIAKWVEIYLQEGSSIPLIVFDSTSAMRTRNEVAQNKTINGQLARVLNGWLRTAWPKFKEEYCWDTRLLMISQLRSVQRPDGSAEDVSTGGRFRLHLDDLRILLRIARDITEVVDQKRAVVGRVIAATVMKYRGRRKASRTTYELRYYDDNKEVLSAGSIEAGEGLAAANPAGASEARAAGSDVSAVRLNGHRPGTSIPV